MKDSVVGIDFDFTLAKNAVNFWDRANFLLGFKPGTVKPPNNFGLSEYPKRIRDTIYDLFTSSTYMGDMVKLPLVDIFLKWLHNRNNEIVIISSRHQTVRNITVAWINNNLEYIDDIRFVDPGKPKIEVFRGTCIKYWIDDNEVDIEYAVSMGIRTFHITRNKWGENIVDGAVRVKGVYNIMEIYNGKKE